ncbi:MAG: tRNA-dihydrouridine synthase, partial [Duodenibacillus sp.]
MSECINRLRLTAAPMEGITTVVWRRLHAEFFGPADRYYLPFVTPTAEPRFTERQLRELDPSVNGSLNVIPQLLTRRAPDFIWAARALADMGYKEVNL